MSTEIDFSKFDITDWLYFLNGKAELTSNSYIKRFNPYNFSKVEMYEYLKFKTDNFDKLKFQLVFDEICGFTFEMDFYRLVKKNGKLKIEWVPEFEVDYSIDFHKPTEFIRKTLELNKGLTVNNQQVVKFIELAENLYQTICEPSPGNTQEGTTEPKPFAGLLKELNDNQLEQLYKFLTNSFIDKEATDRESFDYIFGSNKEKPKEFRPIEWKETKQLLRELLTGLQKEVKYNRQNPETRELSNEIARQTPKYFVKDKTPLKLAANKPYPSFESDNIKNFLSTI